VGVNTTLSKHTVKKNFLECKKWGASINNPLFWLKSSPLLSLRSLGGEVSGRLPKNDIRRCERVLLGAEKDTVSSLNTIERINNSEGSIRLGNKRREFGEKNVQKVAGEKREGRVESSKKK